MRIIPYTACILAALSLPCGFAATARDGAPANTRTRPSRSPIKLTVEGLVSGVDGKAYERVYDTLGYGSRAGNRHKLSELEWDISGVVMGGAAITLERDRLLLRAEGLTALTDGDGQMADYDWFLYDRPDYWTHRSISSVDVDSAWQADFLAALRLFQGSGFAVSILAGVRGMEWQWSDSGAEYVYSSLGAEDGLPSTGYSWEQPDPNAVRDLVWTDNSGATGIRYKQQYWIPYTGIAAAFSAGRFRLGGHCVASGLVHAEDVDDHIFRDLRFTGRSSGGTYVAYGVTARVAIGTRLFVRADVEGQEIREMIGDMTVRDNVSGDRYTAPDSAGMAFQSTTATLAFGLTF